MPVFVKRVLLDAPADDVFLFHERPNALAALSPPFPPVRMIARTGERIEAGSQMELRAGLIRWVAQQTKSEKNRLFLDEQIQGLFVKWIHCHEFEAGGSKTRPTHAIDYELPGGSLEQQVHGWTVNLGLSNMFAHRHRVTRKVVCK